MTSILAAWLVLAAAGPANPPITVAVSGIAAAKGRVHVDICTAMSFTREGCPYSGEAAANAGTTIVTVDNVSPE